MTTAPNVGRNTEVIALTDHYEYRLAIYTSFGIRYYPMPNLERAMVRRDAYRVAIEQGTRDYSDAEVQRRDPRWEIVDD